MATDNSQDPQPELLNADEARRYSRHLALPEIGVEGQARLKRSRALIVGMGGLGSPIALYLAAAGVGTLGLADFDVVDASNLQRQILFTESDVGRSKLDAARERLATVNPWIRIELHPQRIHPAAALRLISAYDLVIDGSDNFATRYLLNDACVLASKPLVYGSVSRFEGMLSVLKPGEGPCYRCLFPEPPPPDRIPDCNDGGVLGIVPGILGTLMGGEALKLLLGAGESLSGRVLWADALTARFRETRLARDPACPVCGNNPRIRELRDEAASCAAGSAPREIDADALDEAMSGGALLVDVREPWECEISRIRGARNIPLNELASRCGELDRARKLIVYCKSGVRSARAAELLRERGFKDVASLRGGIQSYKALYSST